VKSIIPAISFALIVSAPLLLAISQETLAQTSKHDIAADDAAVKKVASELVAAWRAKDVEGIVKQFADDATIMPPGAPVVTSKQASRDYISTAVKDPGFSLNMTVDKVVAARSGDIAYSRGKYSLAMTNPQTHKVDSYAGSFVSVFKKQADGSWKIVEDISAPGP
jgi:uncharacterized protein (TIGR02246 family)